MDGETSAECGCDGLFAVGGVLETYEVMDGMDTTALSDANA